ncbi:site-specific integrase [Serratia proteamaculans]|uniref:Site-specific integrase n=1 Tax=Serratia proteamaculans TaxID=28151 RepID=A0A7U0N7A4_SERPR|nr:MULTISPECIES: site-specific integrase [Serratia]MBO1502644.1 site-specific integrase [Serratia proteamaculans]QQX53698.1 site-specific integrase [Serratia proteamaculans]
MQRYDHLSSTLKAFMLDKPDATREELKSHLKVMAEQFLTDSDAQGYWNMVEPNVDGVMMNLVEDTVSSLKEIAATKHLSTDQHRHIVEALSLLDDVKSKARGDARGLLNRMHGTESSGELTMISNHQNLKSDLPSIASATSISGLAAVYLSEHAVNLSASTLRVAQSNYKTLHEASSGVDMANHSRADLVALRDNLSETRSNSTVNALLAKLSTLLSWAKLNGHINNDYSAKLKFTKGADSKRKAFNPEQVGRLQAEAKGSAVEALVTIAAITGARLGELMQLEVSDVKEIDGITFIDINDDGEGKSLKNKYSRRVVPLVDGALGFDLQSFISGLPAAGPVFQFSKDKAGRDFRYLQERAGADGEGLTFHSLRHSMAGRLKAADVALTTAQAILGHSSNSITYDHYGKGAVAELVKMQDAIAVSLASS